MTVSVSIHNCPATPEAATDTQPGQQSLPVGRRSVISAPALSAQHELLRSAPRQSESGPPGSTANRQALDEMIARHRAAPPGIGVFRLSSENLGSEARVGSEAYHARAESRAPVFFSEYATETPSLAMVQDLPQDKRDYHAVRHAGKRGRDLFTDAPIEGDDSRVGPLKSSPILSTQRSGIRAIRGFAATATIEQSRGEYIARLHQHVVKAVGGESGQIVHLVRPARDPYVEDSTLNFFTFCEQTELARSLNALEATAAKHDKRPPIVFTDNKSLITLSRTSRTDASPIGRLVQQPLFTTTELRPGDKAVIVDDHIQAGGSMLGMESAALNAGVDVLAFAALSAHPFLPQLALSSEVRNFLDHTLATWDPEHLVATHLATLGLPLDKLTNSEALILIAYAIDPADKQAVAEFEAIQTQFFERAHQHNCGIDPDAPDAAEQMARLRQRQDTAGTESARAFIGNARPLEGKHDSLMPVLLQSPESPQEVVQELDKISRSNRATVKASEVKQVVVLDWDDCLRDEKGLNYQIMHNALEMVAQEHAHTLPELREAVSRLRNRMQSGEAAGDGDPLLMKTQEDLSTHLRANPRISRRHIAEDFVRTMLPGLDEPKAKFVADAALTQFMRQYRAQMQPQRNDKPRDLPFPDVRFSLMPGARELLEQCRTAESRVILISNRSHGILEDEVNHLGLAHYFDVVSGVPRVTQPKPGGQPEQMSEKLQQRLIRSLGSDDDSALREVLEEASAHAHPDTTVVHRVDKKPGATRLLQSLASLSVPPDVPITSYGDQNSDVEQLAELAGQGRRIEGVVIHPQRSDAGQQIEVAGIPTRVVRSLNDL